VNAQSKIGYGAYLAIFGSEHLLPELKKQVKVKRFEQTSSTKLELQTLLWALHDIPIAEQKLIVYTDSQNIISLPGRRSRLEQQNYHSRKNILLKNHHLYQQFYQLIDQLDCQFVKVPGHQPEEQKDTFAQLFSLVDKASRKALRENIL
jgi:ribonuclease HI